MGQNDARTQKADQQRRGDEAVDVQIDSAFYPVLFHDMTEALQQTDVFQRPAAGINIFDETLIDGELTHEKKQGAGQPEEKENLAVVFVICLFVRRDGGRGRAVFCGSRVTNKIIATAGFVLYGVVGSHGLIVWRFGSGCAVRPSHLFQRKKAACQACFRCDRQQQPQDHHNPDIVLPAFAQTVPV